MASHPPPQLPDDGWQQRLLPVLAGLASGDDQITDLRLHGSARVEAHRIAALRQGRDRSQAALGAALAAASGPEESTADGLAESLDWLVSEPPQVTARRAGHRVGQTLATEVQARVARLRYLDDTVPGHELAPIAAVEFQATAALVRQASCSSDTGRSLLASLGEARHFSEDPITLISLNHWPG
jgi:hypothetical protein